MKIPFSKPATLRRTKAARLERGIKVEAEVIEDTSIMAAIQPIGINEIKMLPEGKQLSEQIRIFTETPLNDRSDGRVQGDRIIYRNKIYEVYSIMEWEGPINHYEALASLVSEHR